jgi:type I restriction enzyme, S subunit
VVKASDLTKLSAVLIKIGSGITPKGGEKVYCGYGIPLIRSQNVKIGHLDLSDVVYIDDKQHNKMQNSKVLPGDVLLNITGASIGRSCVVPEWLHDANVNQHVCILRPSERINPYYLSAFLNSFEGQKQVFSFQSGGSREGLNYQQIGAMNLRLPSLIEQERIAEILATWDEAIALTERAIEARRRRKNFLIQKFFNPSFFDEEYESLPLEKIAIVERGKFTARPRNDPRYFGGSIPFVQTGDVVASNGFIRSYSQTLNEVGLEVSKLFPKGSILVTIAANIGDVAITEIDVACPDSIVVVQAKTGVCREWLKYALSAKKDDLDALATQNAQKNINLQVLRPLLIHVPSKDRQEKIAKVLLDCDKEIAQTIRLLELYRKQKQGLMQKLLTGEWRVAVQEAA